MENNILNKWGLALGIISLVISGLALIPGYISIIPYIGIAFDIITMIMTVISIIIGIISVFISKIKWPAITGISISAVLLIWAVIRYCTLFIEHSIAAN